MEVNPAVLTLGFTAAAVVMIVLQRRRADLVALLILAGLGLTGLVKSNLLFSGFSSSAVLTILAVSIISEGLRQAGVTHQIGRLIARFGRQDERRLILAVMVSAALLSLIMNNIAVIAVTLPAVTSLSRRARLMPSRLLLPLAFGTILGGMATLLTTSNIIMSGSLISAGLKSFGLLDFLPIGVPVIIVGTAYMVILGRRLMPNRYPAGEAARFQRIHNELEAIYGIDKNLVHLEVMPGSPLADQTLKEGQWMQLLGVWVVGIMRQGQIRFALRPDEFILENDVVIAQGEPRAETLARFNLELRRAPEGNSTFHSDDETVLAELVIAPHNKLEGKCLKELRFREKYGFNVLAIWRQGKPILEKTSEQDLHFGDVLLIQGSAEHLPLLRSEGDFIVLDEEEDVVIKPGKAKLASVITLVTLSAAASGLVPVEEASLIGAACMLLANCLSMDDAYRSVEWRVIFLIAGLWPLNLAISSTGLGLQGVNALLSWFGLLSAPGFAALLLAIALVVTLLLGGQISALLLAPLALSAAQVLKIDPRSLGMALALGCSLAFMTPYSHPINLIIMSSGGYSAKDFLKIGLPLTLLVGIVILLGLHFFWGL
jgi:di/tricarboxylate transporter